MDKWNGRIECVLVCICLPGGPDFHLHVCGRVMTLWMCCPWQEEDITLQEFVAFTSDFEDSQLEDILWLV